MICHGATSSKYLGDTFSGQRVCWSIDFVHWNEALGQGSHQWPGCSSNSSRSISLLGAVCGLIDHGQCNSAGYTDGLLQKSVILEACARGFRSWDVFKSAPFIMEIYGMVVNLLRNISPWVEKPRPPCISYQCVWAEDESLQDWPWWPVIELGFTGAMFCETIFRLCVLGRNEHPRGHASLVWHLWGMGPFWMFLLIQADQATILTGPLLDRNHLLVSSIYN